MKKSIITLFISMFVLSGCYSRLDGGARVRPTPNYNGPQQNQTPLTQGIPLNTGINDDPYADPNSVQFPPYNDPNNTGQQPYGQDPNLIPPDNRQPNIPPQANVPNTQQQNPPTEYQPSQDQSSAVQTLLNDAKDAVGANQLDRAASSLDRAVRLEPRNASIWYDLAQIRLHQGKYQQAEQLARKSISFAGGNANLAKKNWQIISTAKKAQGDTTGANEALRNAQ